MIDLIALIVWVAIFYALFVVFGLFALIPLVFIVAYYD